MGLGARQWTLALAAALLVHVIVAAVLLWQAPSSGARSAGMGGIEVALGPPGGAPGAEAEAVEEAVEEAAEQAVETAAAAASEPAPPPEMEPAAVTEPLPEPAPEPPVQPEAVAVAALAPAVAELEIRPEPLPVEAPPLAAPPPPLAADAPAPATEAARHRASATAGARGSSGRQQAAANGSGEAATSGGMPGTTADYIAVLQAWLERHKQYPRRAQRRRQEGTALLYFVMDADGQVLEHRLQRSSGHSLLDREVVAMIERAQPLPKVPPDMQRERLELVVPVEFFLR